MKTYAALIAIFAVLGVLQLAGLGWIAGTLAVAVVTAELVALALTLADDVPGRRRRRRVPDRSVVAAQRKADLPERAR